MELDRHGNRHQSRRQRDADPEQHVWHIRSVTRAVSRSRVHVLLFLGGLAISAFTIRRGVEPFDQGLTLQAARRVAEGQVPYRDFLWPYGPADAYLLAGLVKA